MGFLLSAGEAQVGLKKYGSASGWCWRSRGSFPSRSVMKAVNSRNSLGTLRKLLSELGLGSELGVCGESKL